MNEIKINYREIEITYNEPTNTWRASGYRNKDSLEAMKKAVDGQLDKPEKSKFERVEAIRLDYLTPEIVTVTSLCEDGGAWFTNSKAQRAKDTKWSLHKYHVLDDTSRKSLADWQELENQIAALKQKQKAIIETFQKLTLPVQS